MRFHYFKIKAWFIITNFDSCLKYNTDYFVSDGGCNPVTGEGIRAVYEGYQSAPVTNKTKPIINKNRVPPGGFSSGLW